MNILIRKKIKMINLILASTISLPFQIVTPNAAAIVVGGQSNAEDRVDASLNNIPSIYVIRRDGLAYDSIGDGFPKAFAIQYLQANTLGFDQIWIIQCAVSGSSITQWKPNQMPYEVCKANINQAMNLGIRIKGFLWHQGESNAKMGLASYKIQLETLVHNIRVIAGDDIPFVAGELGRFLPGGTYPYRASIVNQTRAMTEDDTRAAFVSSEGLIHRGDNLHFITGSYETLGIRYANALRSIEEIEE